MVVLVPLQGHRVAPVAVERDGRDHGLAVDLHDVVQVVIAARSGDEVGHLSAVRPRFRQTLVVVHVSSQDHVRMPVGLRGGIFEHRLHYGAAGVVVIRRVNRVV